MKVTFDIPKIVVIGDEVMIKGTASGGNKIDVLIEDGDIEYFNLIFPHPIYKFSIIFLNIHAF